jgi:hypothetical protein
VELRECFSSSEIIELNAQCELARYSGPASTLQCPFDLAGPVFEAVQEIFVEGAFNCQSWRYNFLVHDATALEMQPLFSPCICLCVLFSDEEKLSCAIPKFAVWCRDRSRTPIITCRYFIQKGSILSHPCKSCQISNHLSFCSTDKFFGTSFA